MPDILITPVDNGFPANFTGDLEDFKNAIIANLSFTVDDNTVIAGRSGGAAPITNVGPWLDGNTWKVWGGSSYVPARVVVGDGTHQTYLSAPGLTADHVLNVPDKSGTLALTSDLFGTRAVTVPTGTNPTLDWSASNNFAQTIAANTTYKFSNSVSGQEIWVVVIAAVNTVTWPTNVNWPSGTLPTQTTSGTDLYIFKNIGGSIYGTQLKAMA